MKTMLITLALSLTSCSAFGHYIWIEPESPNQANLYFGEWHNGEVETEDRRLSRIQANNITPSTHIQSIDRRHDHIAIHLKQPGDFAITEAQSPRIKKNRTDSVRHVLLARTGRNHTQSWLEFDLTPTVKDSQTFTLTYQGKPLAKSRVTVMAPNRWQKSFKTDQNGQITIQTPWKGFYLLKAKYIDNQPGKVGQKPYDQTEYNLTLTFRTSQGIPWNNAN